MWTTLRKHAAHRRADRRRCSTPASIRTRRAGGRARGARSGHRGRDRNRAAGGRQPRRRPHPAPLRQRGDGGDPHQFLSARRATGGAKDAHRDQVRQPQGRRHAAAAAALRDFRLFAARRGRASALRQGGARRHPLVRPAAGFPHRDPRPGEGAEGQERGDRAGRRQGRLRSRSICRPAARAKRSRPKASPPTRCSSRAARHHRQYRPGTTGVVPPPDVVRHDGDDPYLVVAADKGTATFSDIANGIAHRARFLARRRLRLRRLGRLRPQEDGHHRARRLGIGQAPFPRDGRRYRARRRSPWSASATCRATCSATACCARRPSSSSPPSTTATSSSIPTPIRSAAFAERKRLFDLPRSSWQDYDKALISQGRRRLSARRQGNPAFARSADSCSASANSSTPQELIRAILKAPVDLLFFGGIGTYVTRRRTRATTRSATAPTMRSASTAADLRCKVIGEGANLGMTQRGRIEAALHGGRLNTDAIDNSAGVDTSDMEVNIKIALSIPVRDGRLTDGRAQRAAGRDDRRGRRPRAAQQLSADAGAVAGRAARHGGFRLPAAADPDAGSARAARPRGRIPARRHGSSPSAAAARSPSRGRSCRCCSPTPSSRSTTTCSNRRCRTIPISPASSSAISRKPIAERFPDALEHHRLRREIIATQLANSMINRGGPSLIVRIADQTGAAPAAIASAFAAVRDSYGMTALNTRDRRPRQPDSGQAAARSLRGGAGPAARPHHLVPAQRRSCQGPRRRGDALSRRHRRGRRPRSTARCRRSLAARAPRAGRNSPRPACPTSLPAASPISAALDGRARHRAGRRPHRQTGRRSRGDLFRRRRVLPARSHRRRRGATSRLPIISTGWRSIARGI